MCRVNRFCLWPLIILFVLGFIALCMWASLYPTTPTYWITDFSIPIPKHNGCCNNRGSISYTLEIRNSNKKSTLDFKDILLTFTYDPSHDDDDHDQSYSFTDVIESFRQGKNSVRKITRSVRVNSQVWKAFIDGTSKLNSTADEHLDLTARLSTVFRFKTWGMISQKHREDLEGDIHIGSDGKITGSQDELELHHASNM